jgi:large subunit ribosomal protein L35
MPKKKMKMKTNKSVAKRIKITAKGKVLVRAPGRSHLLSGKKSKRKRQMRRARVITGKAAFRLARMAGKA